MKLPFLSAKRANQITQEAVLEARKTAQQETMLLMTGAQSIERMLPGIMPTPSGMSGQGVGQKNGAFAFDDPWLYYPPSSPKRRPGSQIDTNSLRRIADTCDPVRIMIEHLKREIWNIPGRIQPKGAKVGEDVSDADFARCAKAAEFFDEEGGLGGRGRRRSQFESEVIEDVLVIGASAIIYTKTRGGGLFEASTIASETIRPRVDAWGWDDDTAYEQWINGLTIRGFTKDELRYDGIISRSWTPYFASPIEFLLAPILASMKADEWNREWLVSGNAPGDDVFTLPAELSPDQVKVYIDCWDAIMAGNTKERRKIRWLPNGSSKLAGGKRKEMEFAEYELWLLRRIAAMFGVHIAAVGFGGEQYKVAQDDSMDQTSRFGAGALLDYRKATYDNILSRMGYRDLEWINILETAEDATGRADRLSKLVASGIYTPNDARRAEGKKALTQDGADDLQLQPKAAPGAAAQMGDEENANDKADASRVAALSQWKRKALKRVAEGRKASCKFDSDAIPATQRSYLESILLFADSATAVRAAFRESESYAD